MPVLRPMRLTDLDAVLDVQREGAVAALGHIFPQHSHPFPTDRVRLRWSDEIQDADTDCFVIIDPASDVAGFAASRASQLLHFGTALPRWGSGLATRAHNDVLKHVAGQGHRSCWLKVFDENVRAVRFYLKLGWRPSESITRSSFAPHPILRRYDINLSGPSGASGSS